MTFHDACARRWEYGPKSLCQSITLGPRLPLVADRPRASDLTTLALAVMSMAGKYWMRSKRAIGLRNNAPKGIVLILLLLAPVTPQSACDQSRHPAARQFSPSTFRPST